MSERQPNSDPPPVPLPDPQLATLQISTPITTGIHEDDDSDWHRIHLLEDPERWDGMS